MAHVPHPHTSHAAALGSEHVAVDEALYAGGRESLASQGTAAGGRRKSGTPRGPSWTPFEQLAALDSYFSACEVVQESREVDRWQHANKQYPHYVRELDALGRGVSCCTDMRRPSRHSRSHLHSVSSLDGRELQTSSS